MAINPARGDHLAGPQSVKVSPNNYYVVVITTDEKTARELESLSGGESGCHLGRMRQAQLIEAVQEARTAGSLAAQKFAGKLVKFFQPVSQPVPEDDGLSSRERQVMEFLAQGHPYKSIARDLGVSLHTVRNYLRRIYRKLGAHSRTHAVARFLCPAGRTLEA
jgi:DNA-binding NarL/FixJ family response regulator